MCEIPKTRNLWRVPSTFSLVITGTGCWDKCCDAQVRGNQSKETPGPALYTATHSYTQPSRYKLYPTNPNWLSLLLSATTRGGAANCKLVQTLDRGWLLVKCRKWLLLWLKLCSTTGAMKNIKTHPYNYFVCCVSRGLTANTSYRYVDMSR